MVKLSSHVSDVFPKVLKLSSEVSECKPLAGGGARPHLRPAVAQGRAVQFDPMKPKLKPPGTKRSKLNCDVLLSTSAFKLKLRRYIKETDPEAAAAAAAAAEAAAAAAAAAGEGAAADTASAELHWSYSLMANALLLFLVHPRVEGSEMVGSAGKGRFRYIAWVKCAYRAAGKASALRAGKRPRG